MRPIALPRAGHTFAYLRLCGVVIALGMVGCRGARTERSADTAGGSAFTDSLLGALTYPSPALEGARVTLTDGDWRNDAAASALQEATLVITARADLSDDGELDAVVVLMSDPGGTGRFFDIIPVLATSSGPKVGRATNLGDRVRPESLWVVSGLAYLRLVTHDTTDGLCCPTRREERRYRLVTDSLTLEHAMLLERIPPS